MAGTTIGDGLPGTGGLVPPLVDVAGGQVAVVGIPSPAAAGSGSVQPAPLVSPPSSPPPSGGGSGSQPPTPPSGAADYNIVTSVWGMGKNTPKIFENDDFMVKVSFVKAAGPVYPRPVTVGVWADLNFNKQPDPGESYNATTVVPQGFIQARFKAFDDGPWPGNGTPLDAIPIVITVSDRGVVRQVNTGATVYNVAPMFAKLPEYTPGVDSSGRWYIDVTATFWDPGNQDRFDLRLQSGRTNLTSPRMAPEPKGDDVLKQIQHRFYVPSATSLGEVATLTISDDDSGKDTRWNQWQTVGLNNDDDDGNGIIDLRERGLVTGDPDVVKLGGLRAVQPGWLLPQMRRADGELVLFYDPKVVRLWDSPKKDRLFAPYQGLQGEVGHRFLGSETLYVEGVGFGSTDIYATWTPNKPGFFVNEKMNRMVSHSFTINVAGIDVDIDSDNDEGVNTNFERDEWNEYLEDSPYALGKFVGNSADSSYVPFTIQLGYVSDSDYPDLGLRFRYDQQLFTVWEYNKNQLLNGPNQILGSNGTYRLGQLGARSNGRLTFWIQSKKEGDQAQIRKYADDFATGLVGQISVDLVGIPGLNNVITSDSVKVRSIFHNNHDPIDIKDEYGEYAMALQADATIRDLGASRNIYEEANPNENAKFALKELTTAEVKTCLSRSGLTQPAIDNVVHYLSAGGKWKARMYLDHCDTNSGRFIVAFQGTQIFSLRDWATNFNSVLDGASAEHNTARELGSLFVFAAGGGFAGPWGAAALNFSGHSQGGALAAIASYASGVKSVTFNAQSVHPVLFYGSWVNYTRPTPQLQADWQVVYARWSATNRGQGLIKAFNVGGATIGSVDVPDILTWIQDCGSEGARVVVPKADGDRISLQGPDVWDTRGIWESGFFASELQRFRNFDASLREIFNQATDPNDLVWRVLCFAGMDGMSGMMVWWKTAQNHLTAPLLYGLLHDGKNWNAFSPR